METLGTQGTREASALGYALATSLLAIAGGAAGCSFDVHGIDLPSLSSLDAGLGDGAQDSTDLARGGFVPSNVSPTHVQEGASSLAGVHDIDTERLLIDGQAPVPGIVFVPEATHDEWAVLSVRDFTVTSDVRVHGRRALVVIAVGDAHISAVIHAEAKLRSPGPGGQFTGAGHGSDGKSNGAQDSGGGGGGHGAVGAAGGPSKASVNGEGGTGGIAYSGALLGGSGGGDGAGINSTIAQPCPAGGAFSLGGAGGGVIQISAKGALELLALGGINVGGGGGRGGCQDSASAGAGGGAGGTIWLDAPMVRILGRLAANGGGGGSGGRTDAFSGDDGEDGADGTLDAVPARGGMSQGDNSGAGGAGGALSVDAVAGTRDFNAGGGGAGVGKLRIRTRGVAPTTDPSTILSPGSELTTDF